MNTPYENAKGWTTRARQAAGSAAVRLAGHAPLALDVLALAGFVVAVSGVWDIHPPTAKIVGGMVLVVFALLMTRPVRGPQAEESR
jgi:hypothetical protein